MEYEPIAYAFPVVYKDGSMHDKFFATYAEAYAFAASMIEHLREGVPFGDYYGAGHVRYVFSKN